VRNRLPFVNPQNTQYTGVNFVFASVFFVNSQKRLENHVDCGTIIVNGYVPNDVPSPDGEEGRLYRHTNAAAQYFYLLILNRKER